MNLHPLLAQGLTTGVYLVTQRIAIGRFATAERCRWLVSQDFTHVLNVADVPSLAETGTAGFRGTFDVPITDLTRIPDAAACECVRIIHQIMSEPGTKLYLRCTAGQNRSPTVLWLYLIACGMTKDDARCLIGEKSPDSVPGHKSLIDESLIDAVRKFGAVHGLSEIDAAATTPAY